MRTAAYYKYTKAYYAYTAGTYNSIYEEFDGPPYIYDGGPGDLVVIEDADQLRYTSLPWPWPLVTSFSHASNYSESSPNSEWIYNDGDIGVFYHYVYDFAETVKIYINSYQTGVYGKAICYSPDITIYLNAYGLKPFTFPTITAEGFSLTYINYSIYNYCIIPAYYAYTKAYYKYTAPTYNTIPAYYFYQAPKRYDQVLYSYYITYYYYYNSHYYYSYINS